MKLALTLTALAVLSACALPEGVDKKALADAAIAQVQNLNAAGIDPLKLDDTQRALISSGCAFVPLVYPDIGGDIALNCSVVLEAAK